MKHSALLIIFLFSLFVSQGVKAQTETDKTWISAFIGQHDYRGDYGNEFFTFQMPKDLAIGVGVHHYLSPSFDLNYNFLFGSIDTDRFWVNAFNQNLQAKFKFANGSILDEDVAVKPFATLGFGITSLGNGSPEIDKITRSQIPMGIGFEIPINDDLNFIFQTTYNRSLNNDYIDGRSAKYSNTLVDDRNHDDLLTHTIGIKFNLFKKKDADGDGVKDKDDLCINEVGSIETMGCPDMDKDLVADKDDLCPNVAGLSEFNGCPDTDSDGIEDAEDECPTTMGDKIFNGCTDTDGDNVSDPKDLCPTVAGLESTNGCPDSDSDSIIDSKDKCPEEAGSLNNGGCPDSDEDGIIDLEDECPNEAGSTGNNGCPGISEDVQKELDVIFNNLVFGNNSSEIDASSLDDLEKLSEIMANDKDLKLAIEGHTDSRGAAEYNLSLSQSRADAVKNYLVDHGIDAARITSTGFGETKPIDTNDTAEGRTNNRRVELLLSY